MTSNLLTPRSSPLFHCGIFPAQSLRRCAVGPIQQNESQRTRFFKSAQGQTFQVESAFKHTAMFRTWWIHREEMTTCMWEASRCPLTHFCSWCERCARGACRAHGELRMLLTVPGLPAHGMCEWHSRRSLPPSWTIPPQFNLFQQRAHSRLAGT